MYWWSTTGEGLCCLILYATDLGEFYNSVILTLLASESVNTLQSKYTTLICHFDESMKEVVYVQY